MIVLGERLDNVIDEKHGVVVAEHEPPHAGLVAIHGLLDGTRHADRGAEAAAERVGEGGGVAGDDDRRRGIVIGIGIGIVGWRLWWFVEEGEGACGAGGVPEAEVGEATGPGGGGGGDGEEKVAARGGGEKGDESGGGW